MRRKKSKMCGVSIGIMCVIWSLRLTPAVGVPDGAAGVGVGVAEPVDTGTGDGGPLLSGSTTSKSNSEDRSSSRPIGFVAEWDFIQDRDEDEDEVAVKVGNNDKRNVYGNHKEQEQQQQQSINFPSIRGEPGTWQDSNGSWWIYGGRAAGLNNGGTQNNDLSDLWVYKMQNENNGWRLVQDSTLSSTTTTTFTSSSSDSVQFPINLDYPFTLCGSSEAIGLFGNPTSSDVAFDDNSVWVYNTNKFGSSSDQDKDIKPSEEGGRWTSYVCCDLCNPDENDNDNNKSKSSNTTTNLNLCPHFSSQTITFPQDRLGLLGSFESKLGHNSHHQHQKASPINNRSRRYGHTVKEEEEEVNVKVQSLKIEPILWCTQDSLMALQLTFAKSEDSSPCTYSSADSAKTSFTETSSTTTSDGTERYSRSKRMEKAEASEESRTTVSSTNFHLSSNSFSSSASSVSSASQSQDSKTFSSSSITKANEQLSEFQTSPQTSQSLYNNNNNNPEVQVGGEAAEASPFNSPRASSFLKGEKSQIGSSSSFSEISSKDKTSNFLKEEDGTKSSSSSRILSRQTRTRTSSSSSSSTSGESQEQQQMNKECKDSKDEEGQGKGRPLLKSNLNWWKFNLVRMEYEKLPKVRINKANVNSQKKSHNEIYKLFDKTQCRVVSDFSSTTSTTTTSSSSPYIYFLCLPSSTAEEDDPDYQRSTPSPPTPPTPPSSSSLLVRDLYIFNMVTTSITKLPTQIQLNSAFSSHQLWSSSTASILHALYLPESNASLIFIAYSKLIDFWIHDHNSGRVHAVENVWKGRALDSFQHHSSFYKLRIQMQGKSTGTTTTNSTGKSYNVFLLNPRNNDGLFEFSSSSTSPSSSSSSGWFVVNIESDENVFLPSRDTSFMINVEQDEDGHQQKQEIQEEEDSQSQSQSSNNNNNEESLMNSTSPSSSSPPATGPGLKLISPLLRPVVQQQHQPKVQLQLLQAQLEFPVDNKKHEIQFISHSLQKQGVGLGLEEEDDEEILQHDEPQKSSSSSSNTKSFTTHDEVQSESPGNPSTFDSSVERKWKSSYNVTKLNSNSTTTFQKYNNNNNNNSNTKTQHDHEHGENEPQHEMYHVRVRIPKDNTTSTTTTNTNPTSTSNSKDSIIIKTSLSSSSKGHNNGKGNRLIEMEPSIFNQSTSHSHSQNHAQITTTTNSTTSINSNGQGMTVGTSGNQDRDELVPLALPLVSAVPAEAPTTNVKVKVEASQNSSGAKKQNDDSTRRRFIALAQGINNSMVNSKSSRNIGIGSNTSSQLNSSTVVSVAVLGEEDKPANIVHLAHVQLQQREDQHQPVPNGLQSDKIYGGGDVVHEKRRSAAAVGVVVLTKDPQVQTQTKPASSTSKLIDSDINNETSRNLNGSMFQSQSQSPPIVISSTTKATVTAAGNGNGYKIPFTAASHLIMSPVLDNNGKGSNSQQRNRSTRSHGQIFTDDNHESGSSSSSSIANAESSINKSDIPLHRTRITINVSEMDDENSSNNMLYSSSDDNGTSSWTKIGPAAPGEDFTGDGDGGGGGGHDDDDDLEEGEEDTSGSNGSTTILFFALSLSIFATIGLVFFVKRCVKCPSREKGLVGGVGADSTFMPSCSVVDSLALPPVVAPPSLRYSAMSTPDDFYLSTPIV